MLDDLQQRLEQAYDITVPHRAEHFLITDPRLVTLLGADPRHSSEQLLVSQDQEGLAMSLFLDETLVSGAELKLDDYVKVIEGVSHFLYLAWRAGHDRSVTQLELELQAEVDKFFALVQEGRSGPKRLHRRLFTGVRYRQGLSSEQLDRYRTANRLAARVCADWIRRFGDRPDHPAWLAEARRFDRVDQAAKMRWGN